MRDIPGTCPYNSHALDKKKSKIKKHLIKSEECRCFPQFLKVHNFDCPHLRQTCPSHGDKKSRTKMPDPEAASIHPKLLNDRFLHSLETVVNKSTWPTIVNGKTSQKEIETRQTKDLGKNRKVQTDSNDLQRSKSFFDYPNIIKTTKHPAKANKMRKLRKCFHSPCSSLSQLSVGSENAGKDYRKSRMKKLVEDEAAMGDVELDVDERKSEKVLKGPLPFDSVYLSKSKNAHSLADEKDISKALRERSINDVHIYLDKHQLNFPGETKTDPDYNISTFNPFFAYSSNITNSLKKHEDGGKTAGPRKIHIVYAEKGAESEGTEKGPGPGPGSSSAKGGKLTFTDDANVDYNETSDTENSSSTSGKSVFFTPYILVPDDMSEDVVHQKEKESEHKEIQTSDESRDRVMEERQVQTSEVTILNPEKERKRSIHSVHSPTTSPSNSLVHFTKSNEEVNGGSHRLSQRSAGINTSESMFFKDVNDSYSDSWNPTGEHVRQATKGTETAVQQSRIERERSRQSISCNTSFSNLGLDERYPRREELEGRREEMQRKFSDSQKQRTETMGLPRPKMINRETQVRESIEAQKKDVEMLQKRKMVAQEVQTGAACPALCRVARNDKGEDSNKLRMRNRGVQTEPVIEVAVDASEDAVERAEKHHVTYVSSKSKRDVEKRSTLKPIMVTQGVQVRLSTYSDGYNCGQFDEETRSGKVIQEPQGKMLPVQVQTTRSLVDQASNTTVIIHEEKTAIKWGKESSQIISEVKKEVLVQTNDAATTTTTTSTSVKMVQNSFSSGSPSGACGYCSRPSPGQHLENVDIIHCSNNTYTVRSIASPESDLTSEREVQKFLYKCLSESDLEEKKKQLLMDDENEIPLPDSQRSETENYKCECECDSNFIYYKKPSTNKRVTQTDAYEMDTPPASSHTPPKKGEIGQVSDLSDLVEIIDQRFDKMANEIKEMRLCHCLERPQVEGKTVVEREVMTEEIFQNSQTSKIFKREIRFQDEFEDASRKTKDNGKSENSEDQPNIRQSVLLQDDACDDNKYVWICKICASKIKVFTVERGTNTEGTCVKEKASESKTGSADGTQFTSSTTVKQVAKSENANSVKSPRQSAIPVAHHQFFESATSTKIGNNSRIVQAIIPASHQQCFETSVQTTVIPSSSHAPNQMRDGRVALSAPAPVPTTQARVQAQAQARASPKTPSPTGRTTPPASKLPSPRLNADPPSRNREVDGSNKRRRYPSGVNVSTKRQPAPAGPRQSRQPGKTQIPRKHPNNPRAYSVIVSPFWPRQLLRSLQEKAIKQRRIKKLGDGSKQLEKIDEKSECDNGGRFDEGNWLDVAESDGCDKHLLRPSKSWSGRPEEEERLGTDPNLCETVQARTNAAFKGSPRSQQPLVRSHKPNKSDEYISRKRHQSKEPSRGDLEGHVDNSFGDRLRWSRPCERHTQPCDCFFSEMLAYFDRELAQKYSIDFSDLVFGERANSLADGRLSNEDLSEGDELSLGKDESNEGNESAAEEGD